MNSIERKENGCSRRLFVDYCRKFTGRKKIKRCNRSIMHKTSKRRKNDNNRRVHSVPCLSVIKKRGVLPMFVLLLFLIFRTFSPLVFKLYVTGCISRAGPSALTYSPVTSESQIHICLHVRINIQTPIKRSTLSFLFSFLSFISSHTKQQQAKQQTNNQ